MKALKIIAILLAVYVGIVVLFESLLGYFQPASGNTLTITTMEADGTRHDRVLSLLESDGQMYVAVNHWPRAWYHRALENPQVEATIKGEAATYTAVPLEEQEYHRVNSEHPLGPIIRTLTGFPPRYILRLDPRG